MKDIILNIHSMVNIITNSSSEIYTTATGQTVTEIKSLITRILSLGGSSVTCDDLFTVELGKVEESYDDYYSNTPVIVKSKLNSEHGKLNLAAKTQDATDKEELSNQVAKVLGDLVGLFSQDATYNG